MGTEGVISLRVKDIVSECVGVGPGPVGRGPGRGEEALGQCHFPML